MPGGELSPGAVCRLGRAGGFHGGHVHLRRGDAGHGEGGANRALGLRRVVPRGRGGDEHFQPVGMLMHLPAARVEQVENLVNMTARRGVGSGATAMPVGTFGT